MSVPVQAPAWRSLSYWTRKLATKFAERGMEGERAPVSFRVTLERDELDGGWIAECTDLPGVVSEGETQHEAVQNLFDAIAEALAVKMSAHTPPLQPDNDAPNHAEFAVTA